MYIFARLSLREISFSRELVHAKTQRRQEKPSSTAHCSLHSAHGSLLTAHCTVPTAHCSLRSAHGSLLTAHCTVPTAHCSLRRCCVRGLPLRHIYPLDDQPSGHDQPAGHHQHQKHV